MHRLWKSPLFLLFVLLVLVTAAGYGIALAREEWAVRQLPRVRSGQGVPSAPPYDPAANNLHRVLLAMPTDNARGLAWVGSVRYKPPPGWDPSTSLPKSWLAQSLNQAELVAYVRPHSEVVDSRPYDVLLRQGDSVQRGSTTVTRHRRLLEVTLREAHTGRAIAETTLVGGPPPPFPARTDHEDLYGSDPAELLAWWLHPYVLGVDLAAYHAPQALPGILEALRPVVRGQGVPEAAPYDPGDPGLPRLVVLDSAGEPHAWMESLSTDLLPSSLSETGLVVLLGPAVEEAVQTCSYMGGPPIVRYRYLMEVDIRAARTGEVLLRELLVGSEPGACPPRAPVYQTRIEGSRVTPSELSGLLREMLCDGARPCPVALVGHTDEITGVAFSRDGRLVASSSRDGTVRLWSVADGASLQVLTEEGGPVTSLALSPDGELVAGGTMFGVITLWRPADGSKQEIVQGSRDVLSLAFSPDGQTLAAVDAQSDEVRLWRVADRGLQARLKANMPNSVAYSPDGLTLIVATDRNRVDKWNLAKQSVSLTRSVGEGYMRALRSLACSPDGAFFAVAVNWPEPAVHIWEAGRGRKLTVLEGHDGQVTSIAFSPDGKLVATADAGGGVRLWRTHSWEPLGLLRWQAGGVTALAFSPDGQLLASGSKDGTVLLHRVSGGASGARARASEAASQLPAVLAPTPTRQRALPPTRTPMPPTPEPTPTGEPRESAGWRVVVQDSFSDNGAAWPITDQYEDEFWLSLSQQIVDGAYRWQAECKRDVVTWAYPRDRARTDVAVAVDVRQVDGDPDAEAGLVFRLSDDGYYMFKVAPGQQEFTLDLWAGDHWVTLWPWTYSAAIQPQGWNRIEVEAVDTQFTLWINGQPVATLQDDTLEQGRVGLMMGFQIPWGRATFEFDNLEVRAP